MALPNSPYAGTNKGAAPQKASANKGGAQLGVSTIKKRTGFNTHSGFTLPFGAGFLGTKLIHRAGQTVAIHSYTLQGKTQHVAIPVRTAPLRGGNLVAVKLQPQTVQGF